MKGAHGGAVMVDPPRSEIDYPWGDPVPEGRQHRSQCNDVAQALQDWLGRRPDGDRALVCHDTLIYYTEGELGDTVAPDVAVAFGVDAAAEEPKPVYKVWETGVMPAWVLEVASPSTVRGDRGTKRALYAALGVVEYWRSDPTTNGLLDPPLQAERLTGAHRGPITITTDTDGALRGHSPTLGLDLIWRNGQLRLLDPATGTPLSTYHDHAQARTAAETRAAHEAARAAREAAAKRAAETRAAREAAAKRAAETRAERAEAELAALRRRLDPQH